MSLFKRIKENLFLVLIVIAYLVLLIVKPDLGLGSIKNTWYYIKEMLLIMPVIFVLTALLDLWVPKDKIVKFLGKDAGAKGIFLSFVVGSISAGPIYAAFPMCVMLHKKGASIRNIVIILSSWAVIKVPMLLNEAKFLGLKFMLIRWALTVIAIIIFSWLSARIIKDKDLPAEGDRVKKAGLSINRNACMGCGNCANDYPELFEMRGGKAIVKEHKKDLAILENKERISSVCPVNAIEFPES